MTALAPGISQSSSGGYILKVHLPAKRSTFDLGDSGSLLTGSRFAFPAPRAAGMTCGMAPDLDWTG